MSKYKEKIISIIKTAGLVIWGLSVLVGAFIGYDGSRILGLFMGFAIGAGLATLFYMFSNIIKKPYLLLLLLTIPIGYLIGLFWGSIGSFIGMYMGGFMAFILLLRFHDEEF